MEVEVEGCISNTQERTECLDCLPGGRSISSEGILFEPKANEMIVEEHSSSHFNISFDETFDNICNNDGEVTLQLVENGQVLLTAARDDYIHGDPHLVENEGLRSEHERERLNSLPKDHPLCETYNLRDEVSCQSILPGSENLLEGSLNETNDSNMDGNTDLQFSETAIIVDDSNDGSCEGSSDYVLVDRLDFQLVGGGVSVNDVLTDSGDPVNMEGLVQQAPFVQFQDLPHLMQPLEDSNSDDDDEDDDEDDDNSADEEDIQGPACHIDSKLQPLLCSLSASHTYTPRTTPNPVIPSTSISQRQQGNMKFGTTDTVQAQAGIITYSSTDGTYVTLGRPSHPRGSKQYAAIPLSKLPASTGHRHPVVLMRDTESSTRVIKQDQLLLSKPETRRRPRPHYTMPQQNGNFPVRMRRSSRKASTSRVMLNSSGSEEERSPASSTSSALPVTASGGWLRGGVGRTPPITTIPSCTISAPTSTGFSGPAPGLIALPTAAQIQEALLRVRNEPLDSMDLGLGRQQHNAKERARRARIKISCDQLRQLVPGMTGKTDKATVFEFAVHYLGYLKALTGRRYDGDFLNHIASSGLMTEQED